jgi:hypothetical protein
MRRSAKSKFIALRIGRSATLLEAWRTDVRTSSAPLRRATFDPDCRPQTLETRRRADIVVVFHAIARIAERVRRS